MANRCRWLLGALLAIAIGTPTLGVPESRDGAEAQYWIGYLQLPDPNQPELLFVVELTPPADRAGAWAARLDIPLQGELADQGIVCRDVEVKDTAIRFTDPAPPMDNLYEFLLDASGRHGGGRMVLGGQQQIPARIHRASRAEAETARTARPQAVDPSPPYEVRQVTYRNATDGTTLGATLTLPRSQGPAPALLLLSGTGRQDRDCLVGYHAYFAVIADRLTREGFGVLRVDDRGVNQSAGAYEMCSMVELAGDARAGLAFLRGLPEVDASRVGILGVSEGAHVGANLSANDEPGVGPAFLVMVSPLGLTGNQTMAAQERARLEAEGESTPYIDARLEARERAFDLLLSGADRAQFEDALLEGVRVMTDAHRGDGYPASDDQLRVRVAGQVSAFDEPRTRWWLGFDPAPDLRRVRCPVYGVWGGLDLVVPPGVSAPAFEAALRDAPVDGADKRMDVLPGLNHLLQPCLSGSDREYAIVEVAIDGGALDGIVAWIKKKEAR